MLLGTEDTRTKQSTTVNTDSSMIGNTIAISALKNICGIGKQPLVKDIGNTSVTVRLARHAAEEKNALVNP